MLEIDVLLTEAKLTKEFLAGLEQRHLGEKFFYWFPLSVKAWLDLCRGPQAYKNYSRSYQLVSNYATDIRRQCACSEMEVVGLGAGQGDKDLLVLQALGSNNRTLRYRPVDSSQTLLEMAVTRASEAGFRARGLKADIEDPETAKMLAASAEEPRLYLLLGNSLGVIDPLEFLKTLRHLLRKEDHLLLDGEIYGGPTTLQGYDNATNRRFAFAPLGSLGLEEGRDGALVFKSEKDARLEGLHIVTKHFCAARRLKIPVAGQWVKLQPREKISMNPSWKYSSTAFLKIVNENSGFEPLREYRSDDQRFLMVLAARGAQYSPGRTLRTRAAGRDQK